MKFVILVYGMDRLLGENVIRVSDDFRGKLVQRNRIVLMLGDVLQCSLSAVVYGVWS